MSSLPLADALSATERQLLLIEASAQYMRGEISVEAFEELERNYMPDYRSAMLTLARMRRKREGGIRGLFSKIIERIAA